MTFDLLSSLDAFIGRTDTSLANASRLEVELGEQYPDDDYVQEVVVLLAMYRPGGREYLFDAASLRNRLARLKRYIGSLT